MRLFDPHVDETLPVKTTSPNYPGPPRKLTEEMRDYLYDIVVYQNPHIKMRDLVVEVNAAVKKRSIQKLLREMDRRKWRQRARPEIKEHHA